MAETLTLAGFRFTAPVRITPEKTANGRVRAYMPQSRYAKADVKPLNRLETRLLRALRPRWNKRIP